MAHRWEVRENADTIVQPYKGTFIVLRVNKRVEHYKVTPMRRKLCVLKKFRGQRERK